MLLSFYLHIGACWSNYKRFRSVRLISGIWTCAGDYTRLKDEGHKKIYILQYLSDEYNVDERTIYEGY